MRLSELKSDIRELGYSAKETPAGLEVYDSLEGTKFLLSLAPDELRITLRLFNAEAVQKMKHPEALRACAVALSTRPVGCRIECGAEGLTLLDTLAADLCDAEHIATCFSRIHLFEFTFSETISRAGRTGRVPSSDELDRLVAGYLAEVNAQADDAALVDPNDPDLYDEDDDDYEIDDDDDFDY